MDIHSVLVCYFCMIDHSANQYHYDFGYNQREDCSCCCWIGQALSSLLYLYHPMFVDCWCMLVRNHVDVVRQMIKSFIITKQNVSRYNRFWLDWHKCITNSGYISTCTFFLTRAFGTETVSFMFGLNAFIRLWLKLLSFMWCLICTFIWSSTITLTITLTITSTIT